MSESSKIAYLGISVVWDALRTGRGKTSVTWKKVAKFKYLETTVTNQIKFMGILRTD
jgi:hypothetical protein